MNKVQSEAEKGMPKETDKQPSVTESGQLIAELEKPENAKPLAVLLDAEGSVGWSKYTRRDKYKNKEYTYIREIPYISIEMNELESKRTIDKVACLIGATSRTTPPRDGCEPKRHTQVTHKRALAVLHYTEQYLDKFKRMALLLQTLFKYRTEPNLERFRGVITTLFGKYVTSNEANDIMLKMTEKEFNTLIQRAEKLTEEFLT